jgi:glyoxylase-like metal-dependent hydrolase (beta-lactamase superfamily II)
MHRIETLLNGFPGKSSRGFLGWSSCYLVTTPSGKRLLFDTAGYNERATVISSLAKLQVALQDVDCVVLSHLHFDHAANWDLFPNTEIILHEREIEHAESRGDGAVLWYHTPALRAHRRLRLISAETALEEGVRVRHVPGHTPGCVALSIDKEILCGDALKSRWELDGPMAGPVWDADLARQSIDQLKRLGTRLYPGHDMPLELLDGSWRACGPPSVKILFPDGSEQVVSPPNL